MGVYRIGVAMGSVCIQRMKVRTRRIELVLLNTTYVQIHLPEKKVERKEKESNALLYPIYPPLRFVILLQPVVRCMLCCPFSEAMASVEFSRTNVV